MNEESRIAMQRNGAQQNSLFINLHSSFFILNYIKYE